MKKIKSIIENSCSLKPNNLIISNLKWKILTRSILKGKNLMITGPTGSGKTLSVYSVVKALNAEDRFYEFNLGDTQDPRGFLIGNTHFDKSKGTFFSESTFIKAIRKPNSIIFLDEFTRAHPEAHNILMPILDDQRYIRLSEKDDREKVEVAENVSFIATANIGSEYTSTRIADRAITDRFYRIEMDLLTKEQEFNLMKNKFPMGDFETFEIISSITSSIREDAFSEDSTLTNFISTRHAIEMAELSVDGFTLKEICESIVFPMFEDSGGVDSERTYVKQLVQRYIDEDFDDDPPFNA